LLVSRPLCLYLFYLWSGLQLSLTYSSWLVASHWSEFFFKAEVESNSIIILFQYKIYAMPKQKQKEKPGPC
jgi:hypothetical protein